MSRQLLSFTGLFVLWTIASCNPRYCPDHPYKDCRFEWDAGTGPKACEGDEDCAAPVAVCDVGATMTCVQCTPEEPGACSGTTPACVSNACQGCTAHAQCPASNVCLPDGSCADEIQVAYVASGGAGTACTRSSPCATLDNGVKAGRPIVKVATGTIADSQTTTIDGKAVTILAEPEAKLDRTGDGVILEVKNDGADVKIFDLKITGATGSSNPAISMPSGGAPKLSLTHVTVDGNQGTGIVTTSGSLTITRSTVSSNTGGGISITGSGVLTVSRSTIRANAGGGISITGAQFDISNCFILENGGAMSAVGGIDISQIVAPSGIHRLDFNTIASNLAPLTVAVNTGVNCTTIGALLTFDSNIIYGNSVSGGGKQLGGSAMCVASYSDIGPDAASGTTNINMPPLFINAAQGDYHLASTSPAKDAANPAATQLDDIDGDLRPQGSRRDMGADEVRQ